MGSGLVLGSAISVLGQEHLGSVSVNILGISTMVKHFAVVKERCRHGLASAQVRSQIAGLPRIVTSELKTIREASS